eukprot:3964130-Amphidinium_carterae.1
MASEQDWQGFSRMWMLMCNWQNELVDDEGGGCNLVMQRVFSDGTRNDWATHVRWRRRNSLQ